MIRNISILLGCLILQSGLAQFRNTNRDYHPKWYPDGETLIYYSYRPTGPGLYKINIKSRKETQVAARLGSHPNISPDGKWVVYCVKDENGISKLHVIDANTGEPQHIIDHMNEQLSAYHPTWTPDGRILFNIETRGLSNIVITNRDGSGFETLIEGMEATAPKAFDNGRKIAFGAKNGNETFGIYTANIDGSNVKSLTSHDTGHGTPDIWKDGNKMVYEKRIAGISHVFTRNLKTGEDRQLTFGNTNNYFPRWSPDGKSIAYATEKYGFSEIVLMSEDGSNKTNLTANSIDHTNPEYLSDNQFIYSSKTNGFNQLFLSDKKKEKALTKEGYAVEFSAIDRKNKKVYFISNHEGKGQVYMTTLKGKKTQRITSDSTDKVNLAISPDGRFLVLEANVDGNTDILLLNVKSGEIRSILASDKNEGNPSFHPDGRKIIYNNDVDGNYNLYEFNIESRSSKRLTDGEKHEVLGSYSPDGTHIVYSTSGEQSWDLAIMDLGTGQSEVLTSLRHVEFYPKWSVNGDKIIFQSSSDGSNDIYEVRIVDKKITQLTKQ